MSQYGEYADLILVNSTNSVWKKISGTSQYVDIRALPDSLNPKECAHTAITCHGYDISNCNFDIKYQIMDSENNAFRIRGRYKNELGRFDLEVYLENLETSNHKKGSIVSLGWEQNGFIQLFFIGDIDNYIGPNINPESWIQENINLLGNHPLRKVCITGSHDAGMSAVTWSTKLASECNTLTQSNNILGQLKLGIRYFDIRPTLSDGQFFTGHFFKAGFFYEGANGESIASIIEGINQFTETNNELIMIKISHSLNLDVGTFSSYRHFDREQWFDLFDKLSNIKHLYYSAPTGNVADLTLNTLTANGTRSAILFFVDDKKEPDIDLGEYEDAGFFSLSQLNMYHQYSNTNDYSAMAHDQLKKMRDHAPEQYFELEWTLTQSISDASACPTGASFSIKELADIANRVLTEYLLPNTTKTEYPNIILIDNVKDAAATTLALAINWMVLYQD
ncbi:hypothetical protein [Xenorhabdus kozodoii]|uniref:Phosphatidylinositol diacylglycerol-lyase n=1 Tax=Xenorhabdus kozodoii TaxID=351676 RepID=A0A2D0LEH3_9GAMM|nr:hypothetical protein [Xenorhabdus kozodoii]PHM74061.1 hypothetical protein Xkoz_01270 [Xenorhabdus kozodoii]